MPLKDKLKILRVYLNKNQFELGSANSVVLKRISSIGVRGTFIEKIR